MLDKQLFQLLGKDKKYVAVITVVDLLGTLLNMAVTACVCMCLALALDGKTDWLSYAPYIGGGLAFGLLKVFSIWTSGKIRNTLGAKVKKSLRAKAYDKMLELGLDRGGEQTAALTQMIIEGVEQVDTYYSYYLPSFFNAMIAPVLLFIVCVCFRWQVALVLIIALPLIPMSIVFVSKWAKKVFAKYWDKYTSMGDAFLDNLQGMKDLKIFNADGMKEVETAVKSEEFRKITMKVLVMQLWSLTIIDTVAFGAAGIAIVFAILGATAAANPLSPAVALFLILLSAEFFLPMRTLASAFHVAMNGSTAGKRLKAFTELKAHAWGDKQVEKPEELKLSSVEFSYDNERVVLDDINMTFYKGFNAVVGESGSGKSTVISLLLGAYTPQKGEVTLNGVPVRSYSRKAYYERVAAVSYNTYIFNASVRENFRLAKSDITDEEIYTALESVNLKEFIDGVGGLDYVVLEDSENVSGGERQRLALAINLTVEKDMYLFDEATSNIDVESEAIIMEHIRKLAENKIVVVISHRLANVVSADRIYLLDDGKLSESGTHEALMKNKGKYAEIYSEQYSLENGYKGVNGNA